MKTKTISKIIRYVLICIFALFGLMFYSIVQSYILATTCTKAIETYELPHTEKRLAINRGEHENERKYVQNASVNSCWPYTIEITVEHDSCDDSTYCFILVSIFGLKLYGCGNEIRESTESLPIYRVENPI